MKRVVVTGIGAVTPLGNNANEYWDNLLSGKSGAAPITKFDPSKFKTRFACEVKNFDATTVIKASDVRKYDLFTQYALAAVDEAVNNAKIDFNALDKDRIGCIWGGSHGGIGTLEEQLKEFFAGDGTPRFNPFFISKKIPSISSGLISIKYGLRGVTYATAAACSSSNNAIIDAFNYIRWGKADMIITGGAEAPIAQSSVGGFNAAKALSTLNEDYTRACRPFDVARDGFVLGEGGGAVILESLDSALRRNAPILAEMVGGALAADAYHLTGTHPEGEGAVLGMNLALKDADILPSDIDYINAHATSTPIGDISEIKAVKTVFGVKPDLNLSATKSMTGHLLGGAGAIEAIACIRAVKEDIVPPTINSENIEPEFAADFNLTLGKAESRKVIYALNNTFGFGGHIACSVFKKFTD